MSDAFERGMAKRRAILGDEHVDRAQDQTTDFDADFQDLITRVAWGDVWSRPGLSTRDPTPSSTPLTSVATRRIDTGLLM